jgi:hypothetical protein
MLSDFMDHVVARGAEALLPHNLSDTWLEPIYRASARFLRHLAQAPRTEEASPLDLFEDLDGSIFLAAITEILQSRYDYPAYFQIEALPEEVLFESIACYAMYAALEDIFRKHGLVYPHPDADTLLEPQVLREIESETPRLSQLLHEIFSGSGEGES